MGIKCGVAYVDSSTNPIMGCSGCELYSPDTSKNHCYAATLINRYAGCKGWPDKFTEPKLFPERLEKALGWPDLTGAKRPSKPWLDGMPRIIFVNDMSDGFCPDVDPKEWLAPHLRGMARSPHIFLLLTKWPDRMLEFCEDPLPPNVWPGTTVTRWLDDWRIGWLRRVPAERHWVSAEPLLGPTTFDRVDLSHRAIPGISWVVVGAETGPGARPMHLGWARGIREQCVSAGVKFFFKSCGAYVLADGWNQWGTWLDGQIVDPEKVRAIRAAPGDVPVHMVPGGRKTTGRVLDGRTWDEMPEAHNVQMP